MPDAMKETAAGYAHSVETAAKWLLQKLADCTIAHVLKGLWRLRLDHLGSEDADELGRIGTIAIVYCERARMGGEG